MCGLFSSTELFIKTSRVKEMHVYSSPTLEREREWIFFTHLWHHSEVSQCVTWAIIFDNMSSLFTNNLFEFASQWPHFTFSQGQPAGSSFIGAPCLSLAQGPCSALLSQCIHYITQIGSVPLPKIVLYTIYFIVRCTPDLFKSKKKKQDTRSKLFIFKKLSLVWHKAASGEHFFGKKFAVAVKVY